jgi:hypothetical protein
MNSSNSHQIDQLQEPQASFAMVSKAVGLLWKETTNKSSYEALALKDKGRYQQDMEIYKVATN